MRKIFYILLLLTTAANAQPIDTTTYPQLQPFGNVKSVYWYKGAVQIDKDLYLRQFYGQDTTKVLGYNAQGKIVLRTNQGGGANYFAGYGITIRNDSLIVDSSKVPTLYALRDTAGNIRLWVNALFTSYYTVDQVDSLLASWIPAYSDTSNYSDTAKYALNGGMLQGQIGSYYLKRANHTGTQAISTVTGLQGDLDGKVNYTDTAAMLSNYLNAINARLKYTDTASMLTAYRLGLLAKLNISDTGAMLAAYQAAILQRVQYGDTANMLSNYRAAINARVKYSDTSGMLAAYLTAINNLIASKINYSDTTTKVITPEQLRDSLAKESLQAVTARGRNTTAGITINTPTGAYFTDTFVVCGTSIEYGMTLASPTTQCWPVQMGNMLGYGIINLGVPFATYQNNDSLYRRIPPKRPHIKGIIFGGPVNDPQNINDTAGFSLKMRTVFDSLVNYGGYSYSDIYFQTNEFCYRDVRNNTVYPKLLSYNKCISDICTNKSTVLIDLFGFSYKTLGYWATNDGIHPNYQGAQYIAQYTAGFIPKVQHPDNDMFLSNGKVQLGDGIYHRTTKTAKANSGVRLLGVDSTGNEVLINGSNYVQTANILSTESSGGIHTSEDITTDRKLTAGNIQLVPFSLNWWWLGENCYFDYNGSTGFLYNKTGYASKLQMLNGSYILQQAPSGTAGTVPAFTESFQFNQDGTCGIGAHGAGNGTIQNYAIKCWGTNFHVSVGNVNADPGEVFTSTGNIWSQGRNLYIDAGKIAVSTFSGTPQGSVIAPVGSIYLRNDGSDGTTLYTKVSGTGSSGWVPIPTVTQLNLKLDSVNVSNDSVYDWKNGTKTFRFMRTSGGGGSGTVTSASVVTANGFAGSVATSTTTPAITISTTITGILKGNGTAISAATAGTDYLAPNSVITGATKTKITYDANGLVTAGADATTADIAASTNKNYVTDAQQTVIANTSGTNTGDQTSVTGNAGTATTLQTSRSIYGSSFNGSADISGPIIGTYGGTGVNNGSKTITVSGNTSIGSSTNTVSLTTSGNTSVTLPTSGTLATLAGSETLTNKTLTSPVISSISNTGVISVPNVTGTLVQYSEAAITSSSTPAPTGDARQNYLDITALAAAPTISAPSGTAANHNLLTIRIKDNGTARALTWNAIYRAGTTVALPTTTTISKTMHVQFEYNSADTKWDLVGVVDGL